MSDAVRSAVGKLASGGRPSPDEIGASFHAILAGDVVGYVPVTQLFGQRSIDASDPLESLTQKYY